MTELISIVIPTLGRKKEVLECLKSIYKQSYKKIEIIIVDQNCNNMLDDVASEYLDVLNIKHLKVDFKGLSRARNFACTHASGEYIFEMDDDAELFEDTLSVALKLINSNNSDVVFGRCIDRDGKDSVINFSSSAGWLTLKKHEGMFVESTMLIKKEILLSYPFDNNLGVGTFFGAEEGYDLVLRLLKDDKKLFYSPNVRVYHPQKITSYSSSSAIRRVFSYRCGFAKLCSKHSLNLLYYKRFFSLILYIPFCLLFKKDRSRYYIVEFLSLVLCKVVDVDESK